jgi:hypothetical protein
MSRVNLVTELRELVEHIDEQTRLIMAVPQGRCIEECLGDACDDLEHAKARVQRAIRTLDDPTAWIRAGSVP